MGQGYPLPCPLFAFCGPSVAFLCCLWMQAVGVGTFLPRVGTSSPGSARSYLHLFHNIFLRGGSDPTTTRLPPSHPRPRPHTRARTRMMHTRTHAHAHTRAHARAHTHGYALACCCCAGCTGLLCPFSLRFSALPSLPFLRLPSFLLSFLPSFLLCCCTLLLYSALPCTALHYTAVLCGVGRHLYVGSASLQVVRTVPSGAVPYSF